MATKPKSNLTVEEYLKEYEGAPAGRYELVNGEVITMSSETALHARIKGNVYFALRQALEKSNGDCEAFADGMTIKISNNTAREPNASVQCGKSVKANSLILDNPVIVFEVVSPSPGKNDTQRKLIEYFSVPSIQHYVIVDPSDKFIHHHQRSSGERILTSIVRSGDIEFAPPGFSISFQSVFGEVDR